MTDARRVWPLYVAAFVSTFQLSLANISIPDIGRNLHAGPAPLSLVVGAYAAAFAAGLITCGHLGDRHGRLRLFVAGLAALIVVTLLAAAAPGIVWLLAARVLQGLASAAMMPQILATIQSVLSGPQRVLAVSLYSAASGVGTTAGQLVGGAVISALPAGWGWRGAQLSGAVVALIALAGSRNVPRTRSRNPSAVDVPGSVLLGVGLLTLLAALSLGPSSGWAGWDLGLLAVAVLLLAALVLQQRHASRTGRPAVLPATVMVEPAVRLGMALALVFFVGFGAFMYDFSVLTQRGQHLSAFLSGLAIGPFALAFVVASVLAPRMVRRFGGMTLVLGALVQLGCLLAVAALSWSGLRPWAWWFQIPGVVLGVGQAWMFGPLVSTVMQGVPDRVAGLTGGLISTAQQAALGLGVAVIGGAFGQLSRSMTPDAAFGWTVLGQTVLSVAFAGLAWRLHAIGRAAALTPAERPATDASRRAGRATR